MVERGGAIVALLTGLLMLEKLQQELTGYKFRKKENEDDDYNEEVDDDDDDE